MNSLALVLDVDLERETILVISFQYAAAAAVIHGGRCMYVCVLGDDGRERLVPKMPTVRASIGSGHTSYWPWYRFVYITRSPQYVRVDSEK
jgi:hypothetical protein